MTSLLEFLQHVENLVPIPSHPNYFPDWAQDVKRYWSDHASNLDTDLDPLLEFREEIHQAATEGNQRPGAQASSESWQRLLTAPQVEQRTPAWYSETKMILTASEINNLFKGPRTWATLVQSKQHEMTSGPLDIQEGGFSQRLAVSRSETKAMDWGIRYEPVVKEILEDQLGCRITDLGRIRHSVAQKRLAASPDGLFTEGPSELVGRLVEIKCPSTRVIKGDIPMEYWQQMQIQLECCNLQACEYVEAKFKERDILAAPDPEAKASGYITFTMNHETLVGQYIYHKEISPPPPEGEWVHVETYAWDLITLRRSTVSRDPHWFTMASEKMEVFWRDVEGAQKGTWQPPPPRPKKEKPASLQTSAVCAIVDTDEPPLPPESLQDLPLAAATPQWSDTPVATEPSSYTVQETTEKQG